MRILFLAKRQYMGKDLIDDRYGRLYEIPKQLAAMGHQVHVACLSYRRRDIVERRVDGVDWSSGNLGWFPPIGLWRHLNRMRGLVRQFRPDILVGCLDAFQVILARRLSDSLRIPFAADLYDNFESFGATRFPLVLPVFRDAVRAAHAVGCVSDPLRDKVVQEYGYRGPVRLIQNGVDTALFRPMDKCECRKALGLPEDGYLVGTGGALHRNRGIQALYEAFTRLQQERQDLHLVLAGRVDPGVPPPVNARVHYLGELAYDLMPQFYCALDLGVVCNLRSSFGDYCFPQKAYEIASCRTPLIAADVGSMALLLKNHVSALYAPGDSEDLAEKIRRLWSSEHPPVLDVSGWDGQAKTMEVLLDEGIREGKLRRERTGRVSS